MTLCGMSSCCVVRVRVSLFSCGAFRELAEVPKSTKDRSVLVAIERAMFTRQAVLPIVVPGSAPLYLPSNLSSSSNSRLCYVNKSTDVVVVYRGDITHTLKINFSVILQAKYIPSPRDSSILVVSTCSGVQFYSENGEYLVFFYPSSQLLDSLSSSSSSGGYGVVPDYCECTCVASSRDAVYVGTSLGPVLVFNLISEEEISYNKYIDVGSSEKCHISAVACDDDEIFCGTENGAIHSVSASNCSNQGRIATGQGFSVLQLIAKNSMLIAGFADGHVRIYNSSSRDIVYEISAHSKMISGIAASFDQGYFATCSDDHYVRVWGLPNLNGPGKHIKLLQSERVDNRLLTGLALLPNGDLCASSYDDDDIAVLKRL